MSKNFGMMKRELSKRRTMDEEKKLCYDFFSEFQSEEKQWEELNQRKYIGQIQQIYDKDRERLEIEFEDLESFFIEDVYQDFLESIKTNTKKYIDLF